MFYRCGILLFLVGLTLLGAPATTDLAWGQTLNQSTVDSRLTLALRVKGEEVQRLVAAPWQVDPVATGPSKDANLSVTFVDRVLDQDAEGKPVKVPTYRIVAFSVPVKNSQSGEAGPAIVRIFNSSPDGVPGFYKTAQPATVRRELTVKGVGVEPGMVTESWEMQNPAGGSIQLNVQYQRGTPSRAKGEAKPRSAADLNLWRIYRFDQAVDVVKSVPAGIDRVKSYQLKVSVPEFSKLFDGSEQVVSISSVPMYTRQTLLP
jgi:hypothetical protein